jgi:hypothetical protein
MNYKEAINRFQIEYRIACLNEGKRELKLGEEEILLLLSIVYADICNKERLIKEETTINLAVDTFSYTLPAYILSPALIRLNDDTKTLLNEVGLDEMPTGERSAGLPAKWTVDLTNSNRVVLIDTLPEFAYHVTNYPEYRLNVNYWRKIFPYSGTAENRFSDVNFETATTYGGSFLNPTEWDNVIVYGALMKLIPSYAELYTNSYESALKARPTLGYRTLKYNFGVEVDESTR